MRPTLAALTLIALAAYGALAETAAAADKAAAANARDETDTIMLAAAASACAAEDYRAFLTR